MSHWYELAATSAGGILAGAGALAGIFKIRPQNRRTEADSAKVLAQAYGLFVDDLRDEIKALREENAQLRERIASLEAHLSAFVRDKM